MKFFLCLYSCLKLQLYVNKHEVKMHFANCVTLVAVLNHYFN